jgi:hypothetical protein
VVGFVPPPDGDWLDVDGSAGTVTVLARERGIRYRVGQSIINDCKLEFLQCRAPVPSTGEAVGSFGAHGGDQCW